MIVNAKWYSIRNECIGSMHYESYSLATIRKLCKSSAAKDNAVRITLDLGEYQYEFYEYNNGKWFRC